MAWQICTGNTSKIDYLINFELRHCLMARPYDNFGRPTYTREEMRMRWMTNIRPVTLGALLEMEVEDQYQCYIVMALKELVETPHD